MADRAADDAAEHVAAPVVAGNHAVDNQECTGADVIGDHAQGRARFLSPVRCLGRGRDQPLEQIDVVIRVNALHHGSRALEAHAGVHRGLRQRRHGAVRRTLVLHEHEIPDLDVTVAVFVLRAWRAAFNVLAVVVEDLAAGTAGAGIAHRPEIGRLAQARESLRTHADFLEPQVGCLVVVLVDGDPEFFRGNFQRAGHEIPGELDRLALEVVAEAEVAEHLEERMVARRVTDVLEVVVLAAGAHATLRTRGALVAALVLRRGTRP